MSESSSSSGGLGAFGVATVVLIVLKLAEIEPIAAWSWWKVIFLPMGIGILFWISLLGIFMLVGGTAIGGGAISQWWGRRKMLKMMAKADAMDDTEE